MVYIKTRRFVLKTLRRKNVTEKYLSWFSCYEVKKNICFAQKQLSIIDLIQFVMNRAGRKDILFLGIFTKIGDHIGNIKFEPISLKEKSATMGILIGEKDWRGKKVASEVIMASSEYLHKKYGIKYIYLGVNKDNVHAVSIYKKMNFKIFKKSPLIMRLILK
jgi:[ribosomal protein S5]-alanine N-acetyltransferase